MKVSACIRQWELFKGVRKDQVEKIPTYQRQSDTKAVFELSKLYPELLPDYIPLRDKTPILNLAESSGTFSACAAPPR